MYNKKPLPSQATKAEVRDWYRKISTRTVNQVIKAAILEANKTAVVKTSIRAHSLNRHHLEFIFDELGRP